MKNFLTIQDEYFYDIQVEEPESPVGFTYADYLTWNFKERVELIKGNIFKMSPAPTVTHQRVPGNIKVKFSNFLKDQPCKCFHAPST